jgi:hypothetical protein
VIFQGSPGRFQEIGKRERAKGLSGSLCAMCTEESGFLGVGADKKRRNLLTVSVFDSGGGYRTVDCQGISAEEDRFLWLLTKKDLFPGIGTDVDCFPGDHSRRGGGM